MLALESASLKILTDSGGVQREAYYWQKRGVILRDTTEWTEIIDSNWALFYLPGDNPVNLWEICETSLLSNQQFYGSTNVAQKIVDVMEEHLS